MESIYGRKASRKIRTSWSDIVAEVAMGYDMLAVFNGNYVRSTLPYEFILRFDPSDYERDR